MTVATYYNIIFSSRDIPVLVQDLVSVKVVAKSASESILLASKKKEYTVSIYSVQVMLVELQQAKPMKYIMR